MFELRDDNGVTVSQLCFLPLFEFYKDCRFFMMLVFAGKDEIDTF